MGLGAVWKEKVPRRSRKQGEVLKGEEGDHLSCYLIKQILMSTLLYQAWVWI